MTEKELQTAFESLSSSQDTYQIEAGLCRHELDWLYGINLTRLLTESALKQGKGYSLLSTGRVQGPTLKFVVTREEEIQCFTPSPFWTIEATIQKDGRKYGLDYENGRVHTRIEANEVVANCRNANLLVTNMESETIRLSPPFPFDLSSLQSEAYRHFGYTPAKSLAIAERLYLDALISYPRTSSQKLPADIGYRAILQGIATIPEYTSLATRLVNYSSLRPNQGPKQDLAHPAIYPTGQALTRRLTRSESNLLDLIVRRFMTTFGEAGLYERTKITLTKRSHTFFLRGSSLVSYGWMEYYRPYWPDDFRSLPMLRIGDGVPVEKIEAMEKFTEPPPRYNPNSLLRKMEEENIGTKATRSEIIEILYRRSYIKDIRMHATPLAVKTSKVLDKHCPLIADASFTSQLEKDMESILTGEETRATIVTRTIESLRPIIAGLVREENQVGAKLSEAALSLRLLSRTFDCLCPNCHSSLRIIRSRISGKRFIGCSGYAKGCRFALPLPQYGRIKILRQNCKKCGFQLTQVSTSRKRPLTSCARCYSIRVKDRIQASPATILPVISG